MSKKANIMIFVGAGLSLIFWVVDSGVDAYFFNEGTFFTQIVHPELMEVYFRGLVVSLLMGFSIFARFFFLRQTRTEQKLTRSQASLAEIQRVAQVGNWEWDISQNKLYWSDETYRIFGIPKKDFKGTFEAFMGTIHPEEKEMVKKSVNEALNHKEPYAIDHRILLPDGSERIVHEQAEVTFDDEGKPVFMLGSVQDITERMRKELALRESEERFRKVFEFGELAIAIVGLDQRLVQVNPAMLKWLGYSKEESTGLAFPSIIHPDDLDTGLRLWDRLISGALPLYSLEMRLLKKNGEMIWVHLSASVIRDESEHPLYGLAMFKDISARKKAEEKLNNFTEELEWKNLMLSQAKEEAEAANKLKDKFVALVSHDLKSPLSNIIGYMRLVYSDADSGWDEEQKAIFEIIINNAKNMVKLIDELLQISQLQSGQIIPKQEFIEGRSLCNLVIERLGSLAQEKGIELTNDVPAGTRLFADNNLFFAVIQNLLSNAIKFCGKRGKIKLFVPQGRNTTIAVRDNGVGIAGDMAPDLFKHEVKTTTAGTAGETGTGFGLPFAHEIMRAHGGSLSMESEKRKGTVFYAELPNIRPCILLVDDEAGPRIIIRDKLKSLDAEIIEAGNGKEAMDILMKDVIHLIVVDISMPVMNGFELLEEVRREPKIKPIPVIMISGKEVESREKAFQLGANDFITKPVDWENLVRKARSFIK